GTTSACARFGSTSPSATAPPPTRRVSTSARSCVRLATKAITAPRARRLLIASSPASPAPITSTERPPRSPKTCSANAAAAEDTDAGLSPIAVSVRAFLPAWRASRKSRSRIGPVAPDSVAARHLAENPPAARPHRIEPGGDAEEMQRRGLVAEPVQRRAELLLQGEQGRLRLALRLVRGLVGDVQLGAVTGRQANGLAAIPGECPRQLGGVVPVEGGPLPTRDGRLVARNAAEDDAQRKRL